MCAYQTECKKDSFYLSLFKERRLLLSAVYSLLRPMGEEEGQYPWSLTPKVYAEALKELFDLWFEDIQKGEIVSIREFDNWLSMLKGMPPEACSQTGRCSMQNIVEANGDIYPCDFYVLDNCRVANVTDENFRFFQGILPDMEFFKEGVKRGENCKACKCTLFAEEAAEEIIQKKIRIISAKHIRNSLNTVL